MIRYEKKIEVTGNLKTVHGYVEVLLNSGSETYDSYNPSTHDTDPKRRTIHSVIGYSNGSVGFKKHTHDEKKLLELIKEAEQTVKSQLSVIANAHPSTTIADKILKLGYK